MTDHKPPLWLPYPRRELIGMKRCELCGWHPETQNHHPDCPSSTLTPATAAPRPPASQPSAPPRNADVPATNPSSATCATDMGALIVMSSPKRIQRRRERGWRMPPDAVYVGRPSRWGNPYTIPMMRDKIDQVREAFGTTDIDLDPREMAVEAFRCDLTYGPDSIWWWYGPHSQIIEIKHALPELRGRDLACWCPLPPPGEPDHCHGAVLLELANGGEP